MFAHQTALRGQSGVGDHRLEWPDCPDGGPARGWNARLGGVVSQIDGPHFLLVKTTSPGAAILTEIFWSKTK
jgi:hypothetical protein